MITSDSHPVLLLFSYATFVAAASMADTYFPRLTMWFISPSSNHLRAHCRITVKKGTASLEIAFRRDKKRRDNIMSSCSILLPPDGKSICF
jgi:hypothetical protein